MKTLDEIVHAFIFTSGKPELSASCDNVLACAHEWVNDGWGVVDEATPEQLAAAILMEANTQDACVTDGESDPEYPVFLRRFAFYILHYIHDPLWKKD